jgi:PAS domain S-box-containing protein
MTEDGRLFYVNDAACRSLGYSSEELTTMSIPDIDPRHPPETFAEHWRQLREHGSITIETVHQARDGHIYPVEIRANHVIFDDTEYNCAFATDKINHQVKQMTEMLNDYRNFYRQDKEKSVFRIKLTNGHMEMRTIMALFK